MMAYASEVLCFAPGNIAFFLIFLDVIMLNLDVYRECKQEEEMLSFWKMFWMKPVLECFKIWQIVRVCLVFVFCFFLLVDRVPNEKCAFITTYAY